MEPATQARVMGLRVGRGGGGRGTPNVVARPSRRMLPHRVGFKGGGRPTKPLIFYFWLTIHAFETATLLSRIVGHRLAIGPTFIQLCVQPQYRVYQSFYAD